MSPRAEGGGAKIGDVIGHAVDDIGHHIPIKYLVYVVLIIIAAMVVIGHSMVAVGAGERAVVFSRVSGMLPTQLGEGWHVLVPWVWQPTIYDVRRQPWTISIHEQQSKAANASQEPELTALTQDGQEVVLDVSVVYHPDPDFVWRLHQRVGPNYADKVLRPETRAICRMVVSQYPVTEIYSGKREEVQARIGEELGARLKQWDIMLDELLLRNVEFSPEFQQAIEAKQVAIQDYERMQYLLQAADKTRQKTVIEAQGEAEALRLKGDALRSNPLALNYEYARKVGPSVQGIVTGRPTAPGGR